MKDGEEQIFKVNPWDDLKIASFKMWEPSDKFKLCHLEFVNASLCEALVHFYQLIYGRRAEIHRVIR